MEEYDGSIRVKFYELPALKLKSIQLNKDAGFFARFLAASKRRYFSLQQDWEVELDNIEYHPGLNGKITIAKEVDKKTFLVDGASIPLPWFVSLVTFGILRPLGVMLTASIVHDFAFKYGYLLVSEGVEELKKIEIERHVADLLFKDIITTVNRMPIVGYIGWLSVRCGWLFVKYNNRRFGGSPPVKEIISLILLLLFIAYLAYMFPWIVGITFLSIYLIISFID